jgi:NADH:ubiquinone oxidoreductase subunit 2 (subunit N)
MLIIGSAGGLYYYLRLIYTMLQPATSIKDDPAALRMPFGTKAVMALMSLAIIWLGVYPVPFIETLQSLAGSF